MKWGTRYPAVFVNRLWSAIRRNTKRPTRLVCYTDDPTDIDQDVETQPMPPLPLPHSVANLPWRKMALWAKDMPGISGDVLFLDLDTVITGSLDEFFSYAPQSTFCVIENWTQMGSGIGNTSCFRFRVGAHAYLYERMRDDGAGVIGAFRIEQQFISAPFTRKDVLARTLVRELQAYPAAEMAVELLPPGAASVRRQNRMLYGQARSG